MKSMELIGKKDGKGGFCSLFFFGPFVQLAGFVGMVNEGSLQMEKQRWEESEKRREEKRKSQKKEDAGARKGRKVAIHGVFPMMCGSGGSNSRLAKAGAEPSGQLRNRKLHAVLVRSTLRSQNVQSTPFSEHFFRS